MAPSFSGGRYVWTFSIRKCETLWADAILLRTQYWSVSIVTTGTVWTHSPLHPSCRAQSRGQQLLLNAGMNMFSVISSSKCSSWYWCDWPWPHLHFPPHSLTTSAFLLNISTSLAYVQILQSAWFYARTLAHAIPSTWTAFLLLGATSVCPVVQGVLSTHPPPK